MSVGIGSVKRGGFIYSVRCVPRYLVKPAPTQSKTLALAFATRHDITRQKLELVDGHLGYGGSLF